MYRLASVQERAERESDAIDEVSKGTIKRVCDMMGSCWDVDARNVGTGSRSMGRDEIVNQEVRQIQGWFEGWEGRLSENVEVEGLD